MTGLLTDPENPSEKMTWFPQMKTRNMEEESLFPNVPHCLLLRKLEKESQKEAGKIWNPKLEELDDKLMKYVGV
jgi:hypothetical protein